MTTVMLLDDTKDLKAMLNYVQENAAQYKDNYGNISSASVDVIKRAVSTLELDGGDKFFGEPALAVNDWFTTGLDGRGMINILDSESLINKPTLYSTFLLWMMSELFETLPEVGDLDRPKMVFFFDEAHLLFNDAPKVLLDKIGQVVKLIRSKGVGIFFITQNPRDIPNDVLAQLGNKIEHGLHAYTPLEQKAVRAAADSFRENPAFDTFETLMNLGTGEAVISFLDEKGMPGISQKVAILPPQSQMGAITDSDRDRAIKSSVLYTRYAAATDRDSAYEFLKRRGLEEEAKQQQEAAAVEQSAKEQAAADKDCRKKKRRPKQRKRQKAGKNSMRKTVPKACGKIRCQLGDRNDRQGQVGKQIGKQLRHRFGKTRGRKPRREPRKRDPEPRCLNCNNEKPPIMRERIPALPERNCFLKFANF
jgi:hypothetical protein